MVRFFTYQIESQSSRTSLCLATVFATLSGWLSFLIGEIAMDFRNTYYLAGFVDGEGNFGLHRQQPSNFHIVVQISQRLDRRLVLDRIQETFGGIVNVCRLRRNRPGMNPEANLVISDRQSIIGLIDYFDRFPLMLKAAEYKVWREAVLFYYKHSVGSAGQGVSNPNWLIDTMEKYVTELKRLREYGAPHNRLLIEYQPLQLELMTV